MFVTNFVLFFLAISLPFTFAFADSRSSFTDIEVCRAGVATIMGRSLSIVKAEYRNEGTIFVWYVRPDDNSTWKYKCKLSGSRIMWGADDGRWRDHKLDEVVTFKTSGNVIEVRDQYSDGSANIKKYSKNDF